MTYKTNLQFLDLGLFDQIFHFFVGNYPTFQNFDCLTRKIMMSNLTHVFSKEYVLVLFQIDALVIYPLELGRVLIRTNFTRNSLISIISFKIT